ncbi:MAG: AlkA N-terminal domain-containing protein [Polyangiaceae bacterium]
MQLEPEACYRALESRDRRFEGRFIIGVTSTGIYCRPGCPAPIPKRKNVVFFRCAAAAEADGLRPCLRCRPDALPSSAGTLGTPPTVARALRMIADGALDDENVGELAERLGIGERHLRRLFGKYLGASPVAIVQTQRVHFARKLLEETILPMGEVAHSAGFSSVRRFNDAINKTFRETPTGLRQRGDRIRKLLSQENALVLRLPYRAPLDWDGLLAFLAARAIPGVERVADGMYARTIDVGSAKGTLEVRFVPSAPHLLLTLRLRGRAELLPLVSRVRRLFDLDADSSKISAHLKRDPFLAGAVGKRPHLRVPGAWDGFELAVRAIVGQQVTVKGATTLSGRLVTKLGTPLAPEDALERLTHFFPTAEQVAKADLTALGLPRTRFETIRAMAVAFRDAPQMLEAWPTLEEGIAQLTAIPGVGAWTAQYIAMRAAREPDAFPSGDLALRRRLTVRSICPTPREVEARAERWRPFRAYAAMHLWSFPHAN